ncbi:MAG: UMP kinase, partial [Bacteroidota bacterium]|nr:UMP kinase [Bacteroidota bacterium]
LKLSGESLMGSDNYGISTEMLNKYAKQIKEVSDLGVQIGIVIGGGNIYRGLKGEGEGFDRVKGDQMGMLATVINGLAVQSALENIGVDTDVFTAIRMEPVAEFYSKDKAVKSLEQAKVVIFSGGTGNPYFTTDTASALRAIEIGANVVLKGTRVDGVYTADPEKDPKARRYNEISFDDVYKQGLNVMDLTAFTMCKENNMPIIVFNMNKKGNLKELLLNGNIGTIVS